MKGTRLPWALGWASLGIGLTELVFAEGLCRVLGLPKRRAGLVRAFGVRELASGVALLRQPHRREWVWARVAGDAVDLACLASTFRNARADRSWQGFITVAVAGATLVDLYAATRRDNSLPEQRGQLPAEREQDRGASKDVRVSGATIVAAATDAVRQH